MLSFSKIMIFRKASGGIWTPNLYLTKVTLYQLSYRGTFVLVFVRINIFYNVF